MPFTWLLLQAYAIVEVISMLSVVARKVFATEIHMLLVNAFVLKIAL
ncbi:MAG: hypothetical protein R2881_07720 [Eubacteriales bacterium]